MHELPLPVWPLQWWAHTCVDLGQNSTENSSTKAQTTDTLLTKLLMTDSLVGCAPFERWQYVTRQLRLRLRCQPPPQLSHFVKQKAPDLPNSSRGRQGARVPKLARPLDSDGQTCVELSETRSSKANRRLALLRRRSLSELVVNVVQVQVYGQRCPRREVIQ